MIRRFAVLVCALLLFVACGGGEGDGGATGTEDPPDRVTGVILEIDSESIGEVTSFTLKDGDISYEIFIADDVDYSFPLSHLQEHLSTADPVSVDLEVREDDRLYALTIDDA